MGIATHLLPSLLASTVSAHRKSGQVLNLIVPPNKLNPNTSMSQSHHQGIFSFTNELRSESTSTHQVRRERLREQAFEPASLVPLVGIGEERPHGAPEYEAAGILPEMLGFPLSGASSEPAVLPSYRLAPVPAPPRLEGETAGELWHGNRSDGGGSGSSNFLPPPQFPTGLHDSYRNLNQENYQRLSLSLSSSINRMEIPKLEEQLRINSIGDGGLLFFNNNQYPYRSHLCVGSGIVGPSSSLTPSSSLGMVNVLRNSRYTRAAQELLDEFCGVSNSNGRAPIKTKICNNNNNNSVIGSGGAGSSSTSSMDPPPISAADRAEQQRRKSKLLTMLDEASNLLSIFSLSADIRGKRPLN